LHQQRKGAFRKIVIRLEERTVMGKQDAFMGPFLTWSRPLPQAGDAAVASPQVTLTGHEKFMAASQAALGAELSLLVLRQHFTTFALRQMLSLNAALMAIVASRAAAESLGGQSKREHEAP
jgi:hypothetical protein